MYWYSNTINGWDYALMALMMLAIWGWIVGVVLLLSRQPGHSHGPDLRPLERTPHQILSDRFARGEIDEHEYNIRVAALHEQVGS